MNPEGHLVPPIYLDYNATTPVDPAVAAAMRPYIDEHFGNPSSAHAFGRTAKAAVEDARSRVAGLLGAAADEVVFTGGGTEASNHAIKGVVFGSVRSWFGRWSADAHIIISAVEHPATSEPAAFLKRLGCRVTVVPVDGTGRVDPDAVRRAITRRTRLVSVMHSNNEVGTLMPIREIAAICRERGVLCHTDAAQSLGKVPVDVGELGVDLLTVAGHKLYAPKGVGALYIRRGVTLEGFVHGAGHEAGRRAGTENVPSLVGLGVAADLSRAALAAGEGERLQRLRDRLHDGLRERLGGRVVLNGHETARLPNTVNLGFVGCVGGELLAGCSSVAASTGSACHDGKVSRSAVLCAMGRPLEANEGAVRLSVGRFTTEAEIDAAAEALARAVEGQN